MSIQPIAISVVVPVYKEEGNILPFLERLVPVLEDIGTYEIIFCMDPSPDNTENVIKSAIKNNPSINLICFSRRFGQPSAVMAGIHHCRGESCVVIDVDLQDPPELIRDLHAKMREGYDVVYAQRRSRKGETMVKLLVSHLGYKLINKISDVDIPRNTGDFRILSRRVVEELKRLRESHGFLRGMVAFVGFPQSSVLYDRDERAHGTGNYNRFLGSLKIGLNGMIGFSNFLLTCMLLSGICIAVLSFIGALAILYLKFLAGRPYPMGIPTITVLVLFMGGIQLISVGILGEYIGRIYDEVKNRPQYIIDQKTPAVPESGGKDEHAG